MKIGKFKIDLMYVLMILVMVGSLAGGVFLFHKAKTEVQNSGGVKQIIIDIGKDVKDIIKEIEED